MNIEDAIAAGEARLLTRVKIPEIGQDPGYPCVMFLDTETTGLDHMAAQVIEFAYILMTYDPETFKLRKMVNAYSGFNDPGHLLSEEIKKITGITDFNVMGQKLDLPTIIRDIKQSTVIAAHNAAFDRKFCEMLIPQFVGTRWACSIKDIEWGLESSKLDYIGMKLGFFFEAHRALQDVEAMIKFIDHADKLKELIVAADKITYKLAAIGAPFRKKDELKARGYQALYKEGKFIYWYKYFDSAESVHEEQEYLYQFCSRAPITQIDGFSRYSVREDQ